MNQATSTKSTKGQQYKQSDLAPPSMMLAIHPAFLRKASKWRSTHAIFCLRYSKMALEPAAAAAALGTLLDVEILGTRPRHCIIVTSP